MARLPENPLFKEVISSSFRLGKALPKRPSPKAIDVGQFQGVAGAAQGATAGNLRGLGVVTTPFGGSTRGEQFHPGIDIANVIGTNIPVTTAGRVTAVRTGQKQGSPDFGNFVTITDQFGNKHRYSHLNQSFVKLGDVLTAGQPVGTIGNTGQTYSRSSTGSGAHLDYRIRNAFGQFVNPSAFL